MTTDRSEAWPGDPALVLTGLLQTGPILALALDDSGAIARVSGALLKTVGRDAGDLVGAPISALGLSEADLSAPEVAIPRANGTPLRARLALVGRHTVIFSPLPGAPQDQDSQASQMAKARFLSAISHDIRTPMNAIIGFGQLIEQSPETPQKLRKRVQAILEAGQQLSNMLDDLLDVAQADVGILPQNLQLFDAQAFMARLADSWSDAVAELSIAPPAAAQGEPHFVDTSRLRRVIDGVLTHALGPTGQGKIRLETELRQGGSGAATLVCTFFDPQLRMNPLQLRSSFGRAWAKPAMAEVGDTRDHWDLNLAVCGELLARLGGTCAMSGPGPEGLSLAIAVPLRPGQEVEPNVFIPGAEYGLSTSAALSAQAPLEVLVAEDHILSQDYLRDMLQEMGHSVHTVGNGFEALEILTARPIDLVVMDIAMPGLNGLETSQRIRALPDPHCRVPIIGCTVHVSAHAQIEYMRAGITCLLHKPMDRARLETAMAEILAPGP